MVGGLKPLTPVDRLKRILTRQTGMLTKLQGEMNTLTTRCAEAEKSVRLFTEFVESHELYAEFDEFRKNYAS